MKNLAKTFAETMTTKEIEKAIAGAEKDLKEDASIISNKEAYKHNKEIYDLISTLTYAKALKS